MTLVALAGVLKPRRCQFDTAWVLALAAFPGSIASLELAKAFWGGYLWLRPSGVAPSLTVLRRPCLCPC